MQSKNFLVMIIVAIFIVGGIFILSNRNPTQAPSPTTTSTEETTSFIKDETSNESQAMEDEEKTDEREVKEVSMIAKNWEFQPKEIRIKEGEKVKLTVKSIDVTHGFALPDFNVNLNLQPNKEASAEFVADKKGEFTFFCSVFCGKGHKEMKGKLIVE